jgi:hypothetical protein
VWTGTQFLVVFGDDRFGNFEIMGQFISVTGGLLGQPVRITSDNSSSTEPAIGWDGTGFDLAWTDLRGVNEEVHYVRLTAAAIVSGTEATLSGTSAFVEQAALIETPSSAAISWYDDSGQNLFRVAIVQAGSVVANASSTPAIVGTGFTGPGAFAWNGSVLAAAWIAEPTAQDSELEVGVVDPASGALSSIHAAGVAGAANPSMAAGTSGFALAQEPGARLVMRDTTGNPIDAPVSLGGFDPSIGFDGTRFGCAVIKSSLVDLVLVVP